MSDLEFVRRRLEIVEALLREVGGEGNDRPPWLAAPDPLSSLEEPRRSPARALALERQFLLRLLDECHAGQVHKTLEQWRARNERLARTQGETRGGAGAELIALSSSVLGDLLARLDRWLADEEREA